MQWISPDKSSVEPEKKCVARKRKVFEGLGQKSFSYITYIHIHRFFKLLYRNSFSVDTFKKGCILYVYMYVELSFFSPISISKSELERHL